MKTEKNTDFRNSFKTIVFCWVIVYGIHYFAFFIRARYRNAIAALVNTNPGIFQILMYLGHLFFLAAILIYVFAVDKDRKYVRAFLPGNGKNRVGMILLGAVIGFGTNMLCALVAVWHGDISIRISGETNILLFLLALVAVAIQASVEEIESRSLLMGKMLDGGVSIPAVIIVESVFFAWLHAANPGFTFFSFISIAVVGCFYGLAYIYTGSLWFPCAMHTMWNFTQDFILGLPDSGNPSNMSVCTTEVIRGSAFYSEDFGIEGGVTSVAVNALFCIVFALLIVRRRKTESCS